MNRQQIREELSKAEETQKAASESIARLTKLLNEPEGVWRPEINDFYFRAAGGVMKPDSVIFASVLIQQRERLIEHRRCNDLVICSKHDLLHPINLPNIGDSLRQLVAKEIASIEEQLTKLGVEL